jgi:hypothetical protein
MKKSIGNGEQPSVDAYFFKKICHKLAFLNGLETKLE